MQQIKRFIQSPDTAIFFMLFFFYAILYIVLENILEGKVYHFHIRIIGYVLLFGLLFMYFMRRAVKGHSKRLTNRHMIVFIASAFFLAYGVNCVVKERVEKKVHDSKIFLNPLYSKYEAIAKKYDLDMSFTKFTKEQRGPVNYKINSIYAEEAKSIDILLIGDSSVAWGVIPEVIEQISQKKVAIFAYESNVLTEKTAKLFNRLSQYYLKDKGTLILSFNNVFYSKNPNTLLISKKEYKTITSFNRKEFVHFLNKQKHTIRHLLTSNQHTLGTSAIKDITKEKDMKTTAEQISYYKRYQKMYQHFSKYLADTYHMRLKEIKFYTMYLEEYINPQWNKNKNVNIKNKTTTFLRWNMNTTTEYDPNFYHYSRGSIVQPSETLDNKNIERNAMAASKIYGHKKIFMVPIFDKDKDYKLSRNIYNTYYKKNNFKLMDLGLYHPKDAHYPMQGGSHMGNEGGLMKSILIAQWLKEHVND